MNDYIERPRYSCSLAGALMAASALPETIPIVHSVAGCVGNVAWTQQGGSGLQVGGTCGGLGIPGSNLREREVVFGGVDRLREQIANTLKVMDGRLFVVLTGCVSEMIGDDADSVVREFQRSGTAVIAARTGGFRGDSYRGYEELLKVLFRDYVRVSRRKTPGLVNLWGVAPGQDVFWRGNLDAIRDLLEKLGLEVNTFFTGRDTLQNVAGAGSAELNVVVSPFYGLEAAEEFSRFHDTGYLVTPFPVGPTASGRFLRSVADVLSIPKRDVERVIREESDRFYGYLSPLVDIWNDMDLQRYVLPIGDVNYAFALADFLTDDLGWIAPRVVVTDALREDQQAEVLRRRSALRPGPEHNVLFETDVSGIRKRLDPRWFPPGEDPYVESYTPSFVIGSSLDRELAGTLGAGHLSVSFPVSNRAVLDRTYAGYSGGLRLIEDLVSVIVGAR